MSEHIKNDKKLTWELFEETLSDLKKKKKQKYKFLVEAGSDYKVALFNLFKLIWDKEEKPQQWRNSLIVQLYKGKGAQDEFSNLRNIHMKLEIPKFFEHILLKLAKPNIVSGTSKFQIGAIPLHRVQEHLFTLKSVISLYSYLGITLILQLCDISKNFDRESLRDALNAIYLSGVKGKVYKLLFELNKDTQIRIKSSAGISDVRVTGENVAQGSVSGALISSNNILKGALMKYVKMKLK